MLPVQPQPEGSNASTLIFRASPGLAPSTKTGPVTGLISEKSSVAMSADVEAGDSWPDDGSLVSKRTIPPGATLSFGGNALFQP